MRAVGLTAGYCKAESVGPGWTDELEAKVVAQYKAETADLFAADPRLASEIEFDMRRPLTPAPANMMTPSSRGSSAKARRHMTPGSRARIATPASKRSTDKVVLPSPRDGEIGAVRQWNVVPTPGKLV